MSALAAALPTAAKKNEKKALVSRCGFAALIGRPNVGKSTLTNALVGEKISITSARPQTTRSAVRAVAVRSGAQIIFVDCPGWQASAGGRKMNQRMRDCAERQMPRADALVFVMDAAAVRSDDYQLLSRLPVKIPAVAVLNKVDLLRDKNRLLPLIADISARRDFAAIVPVSARKRRGLDDLADAIGKLLPASPPLFGEEQKTDADSRFIAAEFLREKLTRYLGAELPYSLAVEIAAMRRDENKTPPLIRMDAEIIVARASQKAIVIGGGGEAIKRAATAARADMERFFKARVFIRAQVKVRPKWLEDERSLARFGVGAG